MSAAQNHRVDTGFAQRHHGLIHLHLIRRRTADQFLCPAHQSRMTKADYLTISRKLLNQIIQIGALDRRRCRQQANAAIDGTGCRRFDRRHHPDHRHSNVGPELGQDNGTGGITGHHHHIARKLGQALPYKRATALDHHLFGLVAIGKAGIICQVNQLRTGQRLVDTGGDTQATDPGIKHQHPRATVNHGGYHHCRQ